MMGDLEYRVAELERLLMEVISFGKIKEIDESNARVKVAKGGNLTDWIPWTARRSGPDREWWIPEEEEQVLLLCPGGNTALAVALPAIYQTAFPPPSDSRHVHRVEYQDGAITEYNRKTHTLKASIPGTIEASCTGEARITADGKIKAKAKKGIEHDGDGAGACLGTVNGHSLCPFTGTPHIQVSSSVTSSK